MTFWNFKALIYQQARQLPGFSHILNTEINHLKQLITPITLPNQIIDIGTGTGATLKIYESAFHVYAIDSSLKMLKSIRTINKKCYLIQANAISLPIQNHQALFISSIGLTEYIKDLQAYFAEINRVLKPGKYLLITMAPNSFFNYLRNVWGSRLYLRSPSQWKNEIPVNWHLVNQKESLLQCQFLYQKQ